jgi:hypothetical protein
MDTRVDGTPAEISALVAIFELRRQVVEGCSSAEPSPVPDDSTRLRLKAALAALPAGRAADFERLIRRADGPATPVEQPTHCPACHIRLAAQLESRVRNRSVIFACPRCFRLLYRIQSPSDPKERAVCHSRVGQGSGTV